MYRIFAVGYVQRSETIGELFLLSSHPVSKITLELVNSLQLISTLTADNENILTQAMCEYATLFNEIPQSHTLL